MQWRDNDGNLCVGIKPEIIEITEINSEGGKTEDELQKVTKRNRRSGLGTKSDKDSGVNE